MKTIIILVVVLIILFFIYKNKSSFAVINNNLLNNNDLTDSNIINHIQLITDYQNSIIECEKVIRTPLEIPINDLTTSISNDRTQIESFNRAISSLEQQLDSLNVYQTTYKGNSAYANNIEINTSNINDILGKIKDASNSIVIYNKNIEIKNSIISKYNENLSSNNENIKNLFSKIILSNNEIFNKSINNDNLCYSIQSITENNDNNDIIYLNASPNTTQDLKLFFDKKIFYWNIKQNSDMTYNISIYNPNNNQNDNKYLNSQVNDLYAIVSNDNTSNSSKWNIEINNKDGVSIINLPNSTYTNGLYLSYNYYNNSFITLSTLPYFWTINTHPKSSLI